jgi:putative transposase
MIDKDDPDLSIRAQCELTGVALSSLYYKPVPVSDDNLLIMRAIDRVYLAHPAFGSRRIHAHLNRLNELPPMLELLSKEDQEAWPFTPDNPINIKRIKRLMREMGLEAIHPKPNLSKPNKDFREKYPYLLRNLRIDHPNQVHCTDITYIPMDRGFLYLVAVVDWFSRMVLSFRLSNTMEAGFCLDAVSEAIDNHGAPEIFNSDQGPQFTSAEYFSLLEDNHVRISLDGKGRALDNVMVERFWRSLKYEEVYIKHYENGSDAFEGINAYVKHFNESRLHQSLKYRTPKEVHMEGRGTIAQKHHGLREILP